GVRAVGSRGDGRAASIVVADPARRLAARAAVADWRSPIGVVFGAFLRCVRRMEPASQTALLGLAGWICARWAACRGSARARVACAGRVESRRCRLALL